MNIGLAQLVALTSHGNCVLHGIASHGSVDLAQNSSFQRVREVSFTKRRSHDDVRLCSQNVADTVTEWYALLRAEGVVRLALARTRSGRRSLLRLFEAGPFIREEQGAIVAAFNNGKTERWLPEWRVVDGHAADRRIWSVAYRASRRPLVNRFRKFTPAAAAAILDVVLQETADFASLNGMDSWVPWFERAGRVLRGEELTPPFFPDLLPAIGYSSDARQLLNACIAAWPFGGMGSWNDDVPNSRSAKGRYHAVSRHLYVTLMNGIVAATNAFEAPAAADRRART